MHDNCNSGLTDHALSVGARTHHGSLVFVGMKLAALDHNLPVLGLATSKYPWKRMTATAQIL